MSENHRRQTEPSGHITEYIYAYDSLREVKRYRRAPAAGDTTVRGRRRTYRYEQHLLRPLPIATGWGASGEWPGQTEGEPANACKARCIHNWLDDGRKDTCFEHNREKWYTKVMTRYVNPKDDMPTIAGLPVERIDATGFLLAYQYDTLRRLSRFTN